MGTGRTMTTIATAVCRHRTGFPRALIVCPPHLV
jgi:hypothetical protein